MRSSLARCSLWLIVKHDNARMGVLTIDPGSDREVLPVFSFEEEAEAFLRLWAPGTGWRARQTAAGELVSVLYGPCADVKKVALDPLPVTGGEMMIDLVSLGRERFLRSLMGEREPSASRQSSFRAEATSEGSPSKIVTRRIKR